MHLLLFLNICQSSNDSQMNKNWIIVQSILPFNYDMSVEQTSMLIIRRDPTLDTLDVIFHFCPIPCKTMNTLFASEWIDFGCTKTNGVMKVTRYTTRLVSGLNHLKMFQKLGEYVMLHTVTCQLSKGHDCPLASVHSVIISLVIHNTNTVPLAQLYLIAFLTPSATRKSIYINYLY